MEQGFVKVAAVTPKIKVADTKYNGEVICAEIKKAAEQGAKVIVLPELCITGYTCSDLFLQEKLLRAAKEELLRIAVFCETVDAIVFVGLPFVIRAVQPVLEKLDGQYEEAAYMLGASPSKTFRRVILPELRPAILTGFGLALARGIGEYGSVIYISGNSAKEKTQVVSYVIMQKLSYIDYESATAIALVMLVLSFVLLLFVNIVQARQAARTNLL